MRLKYWSENSVDFEQICEFIIIYNVGEKGYRPRSSGVRAIWNLVQFSGDNTLIRYAHSCVITKKLHSIPYDTINHWN